MASFIHFLRLIRLITIFLGCILLNDAAIPFTEEDQEGSVTHSQENGNRPIYFQGQGLGSSRSTNDLPSIHSRVRVYQGRVSLGVDGTLEGLSELRAYVRDDFGEVHDVSIHNIAQEQSYHLISSSIESQRMHQVQVVPDRETNPNEEITQFQEDNFRHIISSDTDDEGVVVPFFPPIGNLLGGGRERTAPIPLGRGAEDVIGREIQTPLVSEQNGPSHTEEGCESEELSVNQESIAYISIPSNTHNDVQLSDNEPHEVVTSGNRPTQTPQTVTQSGGARGGNYQVMLAICMIVLLVCRTSFRILTRRLVQQKNEDYGRKAEEGRD